MLGWVATPGQRVEMTPDGSAFLAADVKTRKLLVNRKLREIFAFKLVMQMLRASENGEVEEETVLSQLALHFPHERPHRILRTVVAWSCYAGLFRYNSTRKVLYGLDTAAPQENRTS